MMLHTLVLQENENTNINMLLLGNTCVWCLGIRNWNGLYLYAFAFTPENYLSDLYQVLGGWFLANTQHFKQELIKVEARAHFVSIFRQLLGTGFLTEAENTPESKFFHNWTWRMWKKNPIKSTQTKTTRCRHTCGLIYMYQLPTYGNSHRHTVRQTRTHSLPKENNPMESGTLKL